MTPAALELCPEPFAGGVRLLSPGVGLFTEAAAQGALLAAGQRAGYLVTLGRPTALVVPAGIAGVVRSAPPALVRAPVDYGAVLYELDELGAQSAATVQREARKATPSGGLVFPAPQSGRYWHRPAPGEPPLVAVGLVLAPGQAAGLIEVMKTFAQVQYRADASRTGRALPERARIVRLIAGDGAEVARGAPLFEVEPA
jgi:biotin carboxyl carrier protein